MFVFIKIAQNESFTSKESERFYGFLLLHGNCNFFEKTCTDSSHQRRFTPMNIHICTLSLFQINNTPPPPPKKKKQQQKKKQKKKTTTNKQQNMANNDWIKFAPGPFGLLSRIKRKTAYFICENKDADQLRSNADQRVCFRHEDSAIPLLSKCEIISLYPSFVAVQSGFFRTWSETPKTGFLTTRLSLYTLFVLFA